MASLIIPAAATVAGAGIQSLGGKSAAKTQAKSAAATLDFAREQEASRSKRYDTAYQNWQQQTAQWNANRNALLRQLGMDIGEAPPMGASAGQTMAQPVSSAQPNMTASAPQAGDFQQGATLADLIRGKGAELGSVWNGPFQGWRTA